MRGLTSVIPDVPFDFTGGDVVVVVRADGGDARTVGLFLAQKAEAVVVPLMFGVPTFSVVCVG